MTNELSLHSAAQQVTLPRPVQVRVPAPRIADVQPLVGAVIVIARWSSGVGADTVAAILRERVGARGGPSTLIDFSLPTDEGPAWDHTGKDTRCIRITKDDDLGAEIGNAIYERPTDLIVINTPKNFLTDIVAVEPEFYPIIREQRRPYCLFWIDHRHDQSSNVLNKYNDAGGTAKCTVLTDDHDRSANVAPPYRGGWPILIPRLPNNIADAFYRQRMPLAQAMEAGRVGDQLALDTRFKNFMSDLRSAL